MTDSHWDMILTQCGRGLDPAIKESDWARGCGIRSGRDYLLAWVATMLQEPQLALPYLFFYGPQNCGKSMFIEAVSLLVSETIPADASFRRPFNSVLDGAIFCWVEETDFSEPKKLQLLIDYVTRQDIRIHSKQQRSRSIRNRTHWCQTANTMDPCPALPSGRITIIPVPPLDKEIPKRILLKALKEELTDFRRFATQCMPLLLRGVA